MRPCCSLVTEATHEAIRGALCHLRKQILSMLFFKKIKTEIKSELSQLLDLTSTSSRVRTQGLSRGQGQMEDLS